MSDTTSASDHSQLLLWIPFIVIWLLSTAVCIADYIISVSRFRSLTSLTSITLQSQFAKSSDVTGASLAGIRSNILRLGTALTDLMLVIILGIQTFFLAPRIQERDDVIPEDVSDLICFRFRGEILLLLCLPLLLFAVLAYLRAWLLLNKSLPLDKSLKYYNPNQTTRTSKLFRVLLLVILLCCAFLVTFPIQPIGTEYCMEAYPRGSKDITTSLIISTWAAIFAVVFSLGLCYGVVHMWYTQLAAHGILPRERDSERAPKSRESSDDDSGKYNAVTSAVKELESVRVIPSDQTRIRSRKEADVEIKISTSKVKQRSRPRTRTALALWRVFGSVWLPWFLATVAYPYLSGYQAPTNVLLLLVATESCASVLWSATLNVPW